MTSPPADEPVGGSFDIASGEDQARVRQRADDLLERHSPAELRSSARRGDLPLDEALALKLAIGRAQLLDSEWSGRLAVGFAMWGEQRRLRPRTDDNPTGEDAMVTKLDQLDWAMADTDIDWTLLAIDDGDPDDSASVARSEADRHRQGHRVTVLRLADAVPAGDGPLAGLRHVDDSRKGGALVLGAHHAMENGVDAFFITDADNSVNLGQLGLLVGPFATTAPGAVIGDRKHPESVLVKAEARWGPGIVVLRHMQRMVGRTLFGSGLRDTQAAFKLYSRPALEAILSGPTTYGFAFDSDWLMATAGTGLPIERVPFAFIDSFAESASIVQGPMSTWESLLTGLVAAVRGRQVEHDAEMAQVIDDYATQEVLDEVVQRVPEALRGVDDADLGDPTLMAPAELRAWLETLTG